MKKSLILLISIAVLLGLGLMVSAAEDPARTGNDVALGGAVMRDGVSYAAETPGWTIYFRPGVRFSNQDRLVTYFEFLVPLYFTDKSVLFFNPKANFDNNQNVEWNVGAGYRHLLANDKLILGGNIFYDGRRSYTHEYYHQIGLGAEVLTEWVNARVNGYISLSDAQETDRWREYYFGSTSLNYSWAYRVEEPMSGLDYEIGFKIPGLSNYVETWVYGGGYNYFSDYTDDMAGWSTRIEVVPADFVKLNFTVRDDNLRDTEYAGEVALELPFSIDNLVAGKDPFEGIGDVFKGSRPMKERLYEQVRRDVDITVNTIDHTRATTPDEVIPGDPDEFIGTIYVDNSVNSPGSGSGTLEDPFGDVDDALGIMNDDRDTIFVFEGLAAYSDSSYNIAGPGVDDFFLYGEGYNPFGLGSGGYPNISGMVNATGINCDSLTLMGFEASGGLNLTNAVVSNSITLGHLMITGTTSAYLVNLGGTHTLNNFTIDSCLIDGGNVAGRHGITGGSATSTMPGTLTITNNEIRNINDWAVFDTNTGMGSDTVIFADNYIHDNNGTIALRGDGGAAYELGTVYVYGNRFENIGNGVELSWAAIEINNTNTLYFYDNVITGVVCGGWGEGQAGQFWKIGTGLFYDNTITNNYQGFAFVAWDTNLSPQTQGWDVSGIRIYNNNIYGNSQFDLMNDDGDYYSGTGNIGTMDAENNYWGGEPSVTGVYGAGNVWGDVDVDPWSSVPYE